MSVLAKRAVQGDVERWPEKQFFGVMRCVFVCVWMNSSGTGTQNEALESPSNTGLAVEDKGVPNLP